MEQLVERARRNDFQAHRLAVDLQLTPRTCERRFRRAFGCPPRQWLAQQQMCAAAALLENGFSAKEVAGALGYGHATSFFREFRRYFGCNPAEYLEQRTLPETLRTQSSGWLSQNATFLSQTATSPGLSISYAL